MLCARRYGDRVKNWATFNEQNVSTMFGYAWDWMAPGIADRSLYLRAVHHKNLAHGAAIDVLRDSVKNAFLGVVHNRQIVYPERFDPAQAAAVEPMDAHWNKIFPDPQILGYYPPLIAAEMQSYAQAGDLRQICRPLDWFGLNHYSPVWAKLDENSVLGFQLGAAPDGAPMTEIGWGIFPDAFALELKEIQRRYKLPIYVMENGCGSNQEKPDANGQVQDTHRIAFLDQYLKAMAQAMREGADVRGYFVWSLLDNFEWGSGYANRFGLVHVDFETLRRVPKASFRWYADLIRANQS
jgi:beta-glucosidase